VPASATFEEIELNAAPGMLVKSGERALVAILIDTDGERIRSIFAIANPDKLDALASAH
jgi:RNA polymerase sigma-70 factor, ECF subfamily